MKKNIIIIILIVFTNYLIAQSDVFYTIQANYNAAAVQLDSIVVENESNGKVLKFTNLPATTAYKINLVKGLVVAAPDITTGLQSLIENANSRFVVSQNYAGTLGLNFTGSATEKVQLAIYNLAGMLEYNQSLSVQPFTNLRINLPQSAIHLVKLTTTKGSQTFRAFGNRNHTGFSASSSTGMQASVSYNSITQPQKITVAELEDDTLGLFNFAYGDRLSIMVYKSNLIASPVSKVLNVDESINFDLLTYADVYTDTNIKTEIPINEGGTIDLTGYTLSYASKSTSILNNGNPQVIRAFGKQRIVRHENGTLTSEANGNIQLTKKGGVQYVSLKNAAGNDIMFTTIDLTKVNNPTALDISSINTESTALASLCLHPYFISSSPKVVETLKGQFKQLPSFNTYKNNLNTKLIEAFKTPQCISIDYSTIEGYANVIFDYLQAYKVEDYNWKGFVEPVFNEWDGSSNVSYKIVNKGKRTIVIYANKQLLDGSALAESDPTTQTENIDYQIKEEPALFVLLEPGKLDYWSTVTGSFFGWINKDMPDYIFKSESGDISVDLGNSNRLELEVWGMGTLHKPISAFTTDEKYKLTFSVFLGILNDFITPGFELISEVKSASEPIASGKFDFRYGSRRKPLFELAKKLGEAYLTDPTNWINVSMAIEKKDYASIISDIPGFIAEEIFSDIDKPQNQTKYLNLIYNAYKNLIGESKQPDFVRGFIKNAYNSTFRNFSIANRTISLLEKIGDFTGSFYYVFADGVYTKSTFTKDFKRVKVAPTYLQLMPGEKKQISVYDGTGNVSFSTSNQSIITAEINPSISADPKVLKVVDVTGANIGKTNLTITDLTNNSKVSIPILVQNQCYTDLDLSTTNLVMGISQNATVKITGGSSKYSIKNTTTQSAVAVLKDNSIIIHARAAGVAQILVKDELSEQTKTITVNVVYFAGLNPTKGLVVYYPFNGNANDESESGNNGTVYGATPTTDRFGKAGKAYSFDGNDMIELPISTPLNTNDFAISVWANHNGNCTSEYCFPITKGSNGDYDLLAIYKDFVALGSSSSSFVIQTKNAISINHWYHYLVVRKDNITSFYLDGVLQGSNSTTVNISNNYKWIIGSQNNAVSVHYLAGKIDDIRIYNRALSSTEVTELYNSEKPITDINNGLVAYYPFNGDAKDGSENGNHGTVNGATLTTDRFGNAGRAYSFDGVNDYISILNSQTLKSPDSEITMSAWVNINNWYYSSAGWAPIISKSSPNSIGQYRFVLSNSNTIAISYSDKVFTPLYSSGWQLNNWYSIVVSIKGGICKTFINGTLNSENLVSSNCTLDAATDLILGSDPLGDNEFFNGKLDDIRIYKRALSSEEVLKLYDFEKPTLKSGLVAYYPFNGNANDITGNGNNGTVNGATLATDRFGNANNAYSFDGVNDYIRKNNFTQVNRNNGDELTVSAWVKSSRLGGQYQDIVTNRSIAGHNWILYQHTNDGAIAFHGSLQYPTNYLPQTNNWIHIVSTVTSTGIAKLYADGVLVFTNNNYTYGPTLPSDLFIGMHGEYGEPFSGSIDDVRIYNRALTSEEVTELYNSEKPDSPIGTFTDSRDGHIYKTIKIGNQTWMAENLAYLPVTPSEPSIGLEDETDWMNKSTPYYYSGYNVAKYGVLYNYYAALTAAPNGWRLPSDEDWSILINNLGGESIAGGKMKTTVDWLNPNTGASNSSLFSSQPSGYRYWDGLINEAQSSYWWSSTSGDAGHAYDRYVYYNNEIATRFNDNKFYGFSVRCIKN